MGGIGPYGTYAAQRMTTLREKLIKIGAKVVAHARYITFQLAEVGVRSELFAAILARIRKRQLVPG